VGEGGDSSPHEDHYIARRASAEFAPWCSAINRGNGVAAECGTDQAE
jgi:hypothetical protein